MTEFNSTNQNNIYKTRFEKALNLNENLNKANEAGNTLYVAKKDPTKEVKVNTWKVLNENDKEVKNRNGVLYKEASCTEIAQKIKYTCINLMNTRLHSSQTKEEEKEVIDNLKIHLQAMIDTKKENYKNIGTGAKIKNFIGKFFGKTSQEQKEIAQLNNTLNEINETQKTRESTLNSQKPLETSDASPKKSDHAFMLEVNEVLKKRIDNMK